MKSPSSPFVVAADSEGEGIAFVACALESFGKLPGEFYDRALVIRTAESLSRTVAVAPDLIAVIASPEVEIASAGLQTSHHLIIVRHRNDTSRDPNVTLDLVDDQTFRDALTSMNLPTVDYDRYARETANSPTILRRRLSDIPEIRWRQRGLPTQFCAKSHPAQFRWWMAGRLGRGSRDHAGTSPDNS